MENKSSDITVSICCITYNHEEYIAQAIEGFLGQKTNFKFEIIIGEDCSTDRTLEIVKDYAKKHPELIRLITSKTNVGSIRNQVRVFNEVKGKYIAFCDGDDYWTDPLKIQKQVDFLEKNPEYIMCCHYSKVIDASGNVLYVSNILKPLSYTYEDFLVGKREETRIGSMMFKNAKEISEIHEKDWYYRTNGTDAFLKLYITAVTGGKVYVLPEIMSCYRQHVGGAWSMIDPKVRKNRMVSDFNIVIKNFKYSSILKRELLKIYLKQYLLFEIRNFKLNNALSTVMTLL